MSTRTLSISFPTDEDDFISRACPRCQGRFKVKVIDGEVEVNCCPFCQHGGSGWETTEQVAYAKAYAANTVLQPALDEIDRAFRGLGRSGRGFSVKVTGRTQRLARPRKPRESATDMQQRTRSVCCNVTVGHDDQLVARFCIACGAATP